MYGAYSIQHNPVDVSALVESEKFKEDRCPFIIDWQNLTAVGVAPTQTSCFKLKLNPDDVQLFLKKRSERNVGVHLRLFSNKFTHENWSVIAAQGINVYINKDFIPIQTSKKSNTKKQGYHTAKPLDISHKAATEMEIEIHCQANFTGVCVAEIASFYTLQQMIDQIETKCRGTLPEKKKCKVCNSKENLSRCSRCKSAWYCGSKHQQEHWPHHQRHCKPYRPPPKLPDVNKASNIDDDIVLGESRVSLRCPLTIKRMSIPVRGVDCHHPQCFDLKGYLGFCQTTGVWQCPVCTRACRFSQLGIDKEMEKILNSTSDEIDQVRMYPDGKFVPIT
eukprot:UN23854